MRSRYATTSGMSLLDKLTLVSLRMVFFDDGIDARSSLDQIPFAVTARAGGTETGGHEKSAALGKTPPLLLAHVYRHRASRLWLRPRLSPSVVCHVCLLSFRARVQRVFRLTIACYVRGTGKRLIQINRAPPRTLPQAPGLQPHRRQRARIDWN